MSRPFQIFYIQMAKSKNSLYSGKDLDLILHTWLPLVDFSTLGLFFIVGIVLLYLYIFKKIILNSNN